MLLLGAAAAAKVLGRPGAVLAPQILQAGWHVLQAGWNLAEEAERRGRGLRVLLLPLQAALPGLQAAAAPTALLPLALALPGLLQVRRRGKTARLRLPGRLLVVARRLILLVVRRAARQGRGRPARQGRPDGLLYLHRLAVCVCVGRQCARSARESVLGGPGEELPALAAAVLRDAALRALFAPLGGKSRSTGGQ